MRRPLQPLYLCVHWTLSYYRVRLSFSTIIILWNYTWRLTPGFCKHLLVSLSEFIRSARLNSPAVQMAVYSHKRRATLATLATLTILVRTQHKQPSTRQKVHFDKAG